MANVQKRPTGKWRARYRDLDGKEHARHFDRKLDAQRWLDEVTTSMVTGQYVDPRAGRVTFEKYAERWEGSLIASEAGERITDNALRLHLVPALGARSMAAIRRNDIQVLFKHLSDQLGPGSVRNVYDVLVRVMTAAVDDKVIASSPCRRITLPHMVTHDLRHFYASALIAGGASVKQVQMVLGHASAVITLRIYAHLWPGEEDRTRAVMDAVLGGLRTGCGPVGSPTSETAGQTA